MENGPLIIIMTNSLIQKNIPKEWRNKKFSDCVVLPAKIKGLKNSEYKLSGKYPIFDQAQEYISGYTDQEGFLNKEIPAILFGDHTRIFKYIKQPFVLGADGTKVFWAQDKIDPAFLFYLLLNQKIPNTGYNRHFKYLKEKNLLIPELNEQKKIADILSSVDEGIQKTDEIVLQIEKMKDGLTQELFTRGIGHKKFKKSKIGNIPEQWIVKKIEEVFDIYVGKDLQKDLFSETKDNEHQYPIYANSLTNSGLYGYSEISRYKKNAITITARGEIGKAFFRDQDFDAIGRLLVLSPKEKADCYFYTEYINRRVKFLIEKTGIAQLTAPKVAACLILEPELLEQKKIADILLSVNEKISINKNLKEKLTQFKKGLMQDLLSGKVRVK